MVRRGAVPVMWILIASVIFVVTAAIVVGGFTGNYGDFGDMVRSWIGQSDRDICATNVDQFCEQDENSGADWSERYPGCEQYAGSIDDNGDTVCD